MVNANGPQEIIAQELERIKEYGKRINLTEIGRRTGTSRSICVDGRGMVISSSRQKRMSSRGDQAEKDFRNSGCFTAERSLAFIGDS